MSTSEVLMPSPEVIEALANKGTKQFTDTCLHISAMPENRAVTEAWINKLGEFMNANPAPVYATITAMQICIEYHAGMGYQCVLDTLKAGKDGQTN